MSKDKAEIFAYHWRILAPDMPALTPEYEFARSVMYTDKRGSKRGRGYRFDFADIDSRVAVEIEGNAWGVAGGGKHMQDRDLEKYNTAALLRWLIFRFSPGMLKRDPQGCVDMVRRAILDSR